MVKFQAGMCGEIIVLLPCFSQRIYLCYGSYHFIAWSNWVCKPVIAVEGKAAGELHSICSRSARHGRSTIPVAGFSIESFSTFLSAYLDEKKLEKVTLFGYSMGGYVALYFAATFPSKVKSLITLGTKFLWDESIAAAEVKMLDPEVIMEKVPAFGEELKNRHLPQDWKIILARTKEMLLRMGIHSPLELAHYHSLKIPCLLLTGDRDKTVSIGETSLFTNSCMNPSWV